MAPDPQTATTRPSLFARARSALGAVDAGRSRAAGAAVAMFLMAAPIATWAGARWTEARVRADIAAVGGAARSRVAAMAATVAARRELTGVVATPSVGGTIDALARVLPRDAALGRAGRDVDHLLSIEVATPDPDRLRAALRRAPATARLRDTGQRGGDGTMLVTLEEAR